MPKNCDVILHLAGQSSGERSFESPQADLNKNTMSTLNLISYGINNKAKRIVFASSMSVYGDHKKIEGRIQTKPKIVLWNKQVNI